MRTEKLLRDQETHITSQGSLFVRFSPVALFRKIGSAWKWYGLARARSLSVHSRRRHADTLCDTHRKEVGL
jgi:hypothetical protein